MFNRKIFNIMKNGTHMVRGTNNEIGQNIPSNYKLYLNNFFHNIEFNYNMYLFNR